MHSTDEELIERFREGDRQAFDMLVLRYQPLVFRLIARVMQSPEPVEDLAQEVFLRAYRGLHRFRCEASFSTWLTRITINVCSKVLRSSAVREVVMKTPPEVAHYPNPLAHAEKVEQSACIQAALNRLPTKQRVVVTLFYLEEFRCEQIAEVLGCSQGTVKSRLYHARKRLKGLLQPSLNLVTPVAEREQS